MSCLSEQKNTEQRKTLARWVDRLLLFDYEIDHTPEKYMGLMDYVSGYPLEMASRGYKLEIMLVVAQNNIVNRLLNRRLRLALV